MNTTQAIRGQESLYKYYKFKHFILQYFHFQYCNHVYNQ